MKHLYRTYCYLLLFLATACSVETQHEVIPRNTVRLNISIDGQNKPSIRAPVYDENYVDEIDVILFKAGSSSFEDYFHSWMPIDDNMITEDPVTGKGFFIQIPEELNSNYYGTHIMIFANAHNLLAQFMEEENVNETTTRPVFHERLSVDYTYPYTGSKPMPMLGFLPYHVNNPEEGYIPSFHIMLTRMFARIDIGIDLRKANQGIRDIFSIQKVHVVGHHSRGCIMRPHDADLIYQDWYIPNVPTNSVRQSVITHTYDYVETENELAMTKTIYVPESAPYTVNEDYQVHIIDENGDQGIRSIASGDYETQLNGMFIILECTFMGVPKRYYRINCITREGEHIEFLRNYQYIIDIRKVYDMGEDDLLTPHYYRPFSPGGRSASGLDYEITIQQ